MLYSGVEFDRTGFTVTVLSQTFAWLGENRFYNASTQPSLSAWMAQFKKKSTDFLKKSFLLASVPRLLDSQQIKRFMPMNECF